MRKPLFKINDQSVNEVNLTPLIDVSLVLVVVLLLANPLAFESSIAVRETRDSARRAAEQKEVNRVELTVISDEQVRVNREVIDRDQLRGFLEELFVELPDPMVIVRCGDNVAHGTFVSVLDDAKSSGAAQVAVVGG